MRPIKLMLGEPKFIDFFSQVGRTFEVDEGLVSKSEEFVCSLYGQDLKHVNDARVALFNTGKHMDDTATQQRFLGETSSQGKLSSRHSSLLPRNQSKHPAAKQPWVDN